MPNYEPPFTLNNKILTLVANISNKVGRLSVEFEQSQLRSRKVNRMRTIQGSLAIEGNTLSEEQITAMLEGKRVIAPPKEVQEAHNAIEVYDQLDRWQPAKEADLLAAHKALMMGLVTEAGQYRSGGVGVMSDEQVVHMAPQAERVPKLMADLLAWVAKSDAHTLIVSCVFHSEFEFIHPFADGNGRMGRLWQTLLLARWQPVFANIPVESLVYQHQEDYYRAIRESTALGESTPFIEFMLQMILDAVIELDKLPDDGVNDGLNDGVKQPKLSALQVQILNILKADPHTTVQQLVLATGKSTRTIERHLKTLREKHLLERIGPDKTGYWNVLL